jgi:hypothetical protein
MRNDCARYRAISQVRDDNVRDDNVRDANAAVLAAVHGDLEKRSRGDAKVQGRFAHGRDWIK